MRRVWLALFVLAGIWIAALVYRGAPVAADEIEFFRATRWIGEGKVPFRDFWEHHTPLQWMVFAPVARLFANGPGVESIVAMRWAQLPMWIALFALLAWLAKREGIGIGPAAVLLLVSGTFVRKAVEYRVDVPGNLAFVAAVALIASGATRRRWIGFGALMSAAVLANMRLAPLVVIAAIVVSFWRPEERRWRWNASSLWMIAGVAIVAAAFITFLALTGAWGAFVENVVHYNLASAKLLEVDTFFDAFLLPVWTLDYAGIGFWIAALAGLLLALRGIRTPGPLQILALLAIASAATIALMEVQYDYHFQNVWLLLLPLAAAAIERFRWSIAVALLAAVGLTQFIARTAPAFGAETDYQDEVMTTVDTSTRPGETVFDGAGFALRREPAYRYWFLTTGVRMLAQQRILPQYDAGQMAANPPAAVIADYRMRVYLRSFPALTGYATRHYVPVFRNLWLPGMSALVGPEPQEVRWIAPRAGQYDVYASAALATHPWFTDPLRYLEVQGPAAPRYAMPLRQLPPLPEGALQWIVDDVPQAAGVRTLTLRKGARVELRAFPGQRAAVLLVPHGVDTLALAPPEPFVF